MAVVREFRDFFREYSVITLSVGVMMGAAANDLVKSLVDNVVMPLLNPLIPNGTWETATFSFGGVVLGWGAFLSALLRFVILAVVVFVFVKKLLRYRK